ncbi:ROK family transcriptional regulator [Pseudarthrobacter sp. J75]|uniref:ROK family transcriptional regulator n=1 Tax=unclassified Pseudarthrobacter TaxID=2647000 RepID=UPI002E80161F|nr:MULTISPECIES: ROK family transcriptional regulator [unclassified Pseudarthrobacter]MEE2521555.1 ROK family transcriptional regulator [Pseudarthrobacter sp. J47]MEE2527632.1 ROK family transcriptional regulator [Pseudarthrobacter sp. J75]MEE2570732.1 ROK family transcriptional regulator [Pseudarthrobacter sp. J64]
MPATSRPTKSRTRNPGSQSALRHLNQQRIIEALMGGPATQAELARQTGLSTATVSNIVKIMQESGLASTEPTTSSGRRALNVRLNSNGAVAVGIDFGRRHLRVVLASMSYHIIAEESVQLPLGHHAEEGIRAAVELLSRLLAEYGVERDALVGAGVGIPGPIDRRTSTVAQGAILPEWVGINILDRLEETLDMPVFLDNDANLGALSEVTWGQHGSVTNLLFIKIGSGIGAGLILNGAPYYGAVGITGEIGHATIHEQGLICRCGNRGCLETIASTTTMIELLGRGSRGQLTPADLVSRALARDPATLRVIDDAGLAVGRALGNVANLINPEVIVVGGPLAGLEDLLLDPIRRGLIRHAVPVIGESTVLTMSSLGDRAEALGAAALVFQHARFRRP